MATSEDPKKTPYINDFISRSFRDVADQDYLAARAAFRADLALPVLTNGHQALEKYLKAILLYNRQSTKSLGHDLEEALEALQGISDIAFDFPPDVVETIKYFEAHGRSRYFEYSYHKRDDVCLRLDRTVWFIRRYCRYLRGTLPNGRSLLQARVEAIQRKEALAAPHKYRLIGGFLEKVLSERNSNLGEQRKLLVWKNFYFSSRHRKTIKKYKSSWSAANTPLSLHPEIYDDLKPFVKFSKEFDKEIKQYIADRAKKP